MEPIYGLTWWQFGAYVLMSGFCWHLGAGIASRLVGRSWKKT